MTSALMLAKVRTFLDEAAAGQWSDAEIYSGLTDGQMKYALAILTQFKARAAINPPEPLPEVLFPLFTEATATISALIASITKPADYMADLSLKITKDGTAYYPLRKELSRTVGHEIKNSLLGDGAGVISYYYVKDNVVWDGIGVAGSQTYFFDYLKVPTDISAVVEPILPVYTHPAICRYAFGDVLKKARLFGGSQAAFQDFLTMIKYQ